MGFKRTADTSVRNILLRERLLNKYSAQVRSGMDAHDVAIRVNNILGAIGLEKLKHEWLTRVLVKRSSRGD